MRVQWAKRLGKAGWRGEKLRGGTERAMAGQRPGADLAARQQGWRTEWDSIPV